MTGFPGKSYTKVFAVVETVISIVVVGLIVAIVIPKYGDISLKAKESSCKMSLDSLRAAVSIWYAREIASGSRNPAFPPIDSLRSVGVVMKRSIPANPFQPNAGDSIVAGDKKGETVGERGGWVYNVRTGEIWANTKGSGENNL